MEINKDIETPIGGHKIVIKTMLTGAEREKVDNAEMQFVKTEDGQKFTVTDMAKMTTAKKHKLLEVSVVSIDADATDVLARLQKMYEPDYNFVFAEIEAEQKKMTVLTLEG